MIEGIDEDLQQLLDTKSELKKLFGLDLNKEKYPLSIYKKVARELASHYDEELIYQIFDEYLPSDAWKSWDASQRKNRLHDAITEAVAESEAKKSEETNQPTATKDTKKESKNNNIPENIQALIDEAKESDLEGLMDCAGWINEHYLELTCIEERYWKKQELEKQTHGNIKHFFWKL